MARRCPARAPAARSSSSAAPRVEARINLLLAGVRVERSTMLQTTSRRDLIPRRKGTGRVARFHVALAVGNYDGLVGLGIADASSMQKATADAYFRAYANVTPVLRCARGGVVGRCVCGACFARGGCALISRSITDGRTAPPRGGRARAARDFATSSLPTHAHTKQTQTNTNKHKHKHTQTNTNTHPKGIAATRCTTRSTRRSTSCACACGRAARALA